MPDQKLPTISPHDLVTATGGLNTTGFRESKNVVDRRSKQAVAADTKWWNSLHH